MVISNTCVFFQRSIYPRTTAASLYVMMVGVTPYKPFLKVPLLFGSLSPSKFDGKISSFADPGCLSWILNPGSEFFPSRIPDPGSKFFPSWIADPGSEFFPSRMLDPGSASKNLSILTKKNGFSALRNMIRVFHPGSGSRI
jgi:hypothetical protein